jgi:hypothetical protein
MSRPPATLRLTPKDEVLMEDLLASSRARLASAAAKSVIGPREFSLAFVERQHAFTALALGESLEESQGRTESELQRLRGEESDGE